jgi:branched-chain amino acid transport system permease protein
LIRPSFRRDSPPGFGGLLGAIVGPLIVTGLVTLIAAVVYANDTMTEIVLLFGINAVMVVGFQVFVGNTGLVSFGHVAFMAIGAYATAIVSMDDIDKSIVLKDLPGWLADVHLGVAPSLIVGGAAAAVFALVTGVALMRLSGAAASIATLGLLVITVNVLSQASEFTHGPRSIFGVPDKTNFFWVFSSLAVAVLIASVYKWSRAGLRARANRDDVVAAETLGVAPLRARLLPFVLSAFLTGVGGGLYAMLLTAFSPASFAIPLVVVVLTMAIIGGVQSITGALTGAAVVTVLNEILRRVENGVDVFGLHLKTATGMSGAVLGVALILMLKWRPSGLLSAFEFQIEGSRQRPMPAPAQASAPTSASPPPTGGTHASQRV